MTEQKLSDLIQTGAAISRSISLERDEGNADTIRRYHVTAKALEVLKRFASGLTGEPVTAWSITGPYGMGKSSFVNFLLALCGPKNTAETRLAMSMLWEIDVNFAHQLNDAICQNNFETRGFLRIPITASFDSVHGTLAKGLKRAIAKTKSQTANKREISDLIGTLDKILKQNNRNGDSKTLVECFRLAAKLHGGPIVLVIDEFGKNLEFMARYPDKGDLFIMQELAETPEIFLFVCLHLAFDTYVAGFSMRQLQEWGKIQGRFEDISFVETRQQMVGFVQSSLQKENTSIPFNNLTEAWASELYQAMKNLDVPYFEGWTSDDVNRLYPIHPLAAVILPELCIRFAQSDRTLFAFLCGGEPNAFPAYLSSARFSEEGQSVPTFGPEYLYDYFLASANSVTSNRPEARRWIEVNNLIHKSRHLASHQLNLIKIIGLLNLISSSVGLRASKALLTFGLIKPFSRDKKSKPNATEILNVLQKSGTTLYREYADEYRLWEGTDFDIPKATAKLKALIKPLPLHEVLEATLPLTPLTASRHSYESGALRHFERLWITSTALNETPPECSADEADGLILYCLGKDVEFKPSHSFTESGKPLVLVYANFEEQVQDLVLEAAAAQRLLKDSPELARDGIARREARYRMRMTEERLRRYLEDLFRPGSSEITWFTGGERVAISTYRQLSNQLSALCDVTYGNCPILRNELINRNRMSSAAARARRELMQAMIMKEKRENLDMEGTGPEVAIYRSIFLVENFHTKAANGCWAFHPPTERSSYYPAWQCLLDTIELANDDPVPVATLLNVLRRPPYGMKQGPIPLLICFLLLVKNEELALFQEDAFVPFFGPEEMELMAKQPRYFSIRKFSPTGFQSDLFKVYLDLISASAIPKGAALRNASLVGIIGPLVQFVARANEYTKNTRAISPQARKVRHVLVHAKDPIQLLFKELPEAVGIEFPEKDAAFSQELILSFHKNLRNALQELANAYPCLLLQIKITFSDVIQEDIPISQVRKTLAQKAFVLVTRCTDPELKPFLSVLASEVKNDEEWIIAVATIVMQRPVDAWKDSDLQAFPIRLQHRFNRFNRFEAVFAAKEELPVGDNHKQPRLLTITSPDGKTAEKVLWVSDEKLNDIEEQAKALIKNSSQQDIEALTAVLAEKLLTMNMTEEPTP